MGSDVARLEAYGVERWLDDRGQAGVRPDPRVREVPVELAFSAPEFEIFPGARVLVHRAEGLLETPGVDTCLVCQLADRVSLVQETGFEIQLRERPVRAQPR